MTKLDFRAVSVLPADLAPNTFYFVQNGTYAESFLTTVDGALRRIGNSRMVQDIVRTELLEHYKNNLEVAVDIPARNALGVLATRSFMVIVIDATDDPGVSEGSALYAYDYQFQEWYLLTAYGTAATSVAWADVTGKPNSSKNQLDEAVAKSHTHDNTDTLVLLGTAADGTLLFSGNKIGSARWTGEEW